MREYGAAGGGMQARVHIRIEAADDFWNRVRAVPDARKYLRLALQAVIEISLEKRLGITNRRAVGGIENPVVTRDQFLQACDVLRHIAVRRRNDGCRPAHYVIAGEQCL